MNSPNSRNISIAAPVSKEFGTILTPEALQFVEDLCVRFEGRRQELLSRRQAVQARIDKGALPDFLPETASIRNDDWRVSPVPALPPVPAPPGFWLTGSPGGGGRGRRIDQPELRTRTRGLQLSSMTHGDYVVVA